MEIIKYYFFVSLILFSNNIYAHQQAWDDDKSSWTDLQLAIYYGENNDIITQLINDNLESLNECRNGTNTIEMAIRLNNEFAVYKLLNSGVIFDLDELLIWACLVNSNIQIIEYLCNFGANVNYIRENGYNCLMAATSFSTIEIMQYLVVQNINVNLGRRSGDGATALTLAIYNFDYEKISLLLEAGANKNNINFNGETAYVFAERYTLI